MSANPESADPKSAEPMGPDLPAPSGGGPEVDGSSTRWQQIARLRRLRPRRRFASRSLALLFSLLIGSWFVGNFHLDDLIATKRIENMRRFASEVMPFPLQGQPFDARIALTWAHEVMLEKGWSGAGKTLAISVMAIVLAGLFSSLLSFFATRTLAAPEPFVASLRPPERLRVVGWRMVVALARALFVIARSIPAYLWAFLLVSMLGPTAWPAVLALAIHNTGILGKLSAEVNENLDQEPLAAMRGMGASRRQIALFAIFPLTLPRFLLFFFYRWETCVRQATVLGMLGIVSLGYWIQDARARNHYDEMVLLILTSVVLVLVGDVISIALRELIRRRS